MQLLTLIPNRCCHFCLATASDYSTGACHKNPLSPFSPAQHMEQTADEMWYEGFQEHGFFSFFSFFPLSCFCLLLVTLAPLWVAFADSFLDACGATKIAYEVAGVELLSVLFFWQIAPFCVMEELLYVFKMYEYNSKRIRCTVKTPLYWNVEHMFNLAWYLTLTVSIHVVIFFYINAGNGHSSSPVCKGWPKPIRPSFELSAFFPQVFLKDLLS